MIFIGILFFNIGMPFYASIISHEIITTLEQDAGKGIDPQLAELLLLRPVRPTLPHRTPPIQTTTRLLLCKI